MKRIRIANLAMSVCLFALLNANFTSYSFYEEIVSAANQTPTSIPVGIAENSITPTLTPQSTLLSNNEILEQAVLTVPTDGLITSTEASTVESDANDPGSTITDQIEGNMPTPLPQEKDTAFPFAVSLEGSQIDDGLTETTTPTSIPTPSLMSGVDNSLNFTP